MSLLDKISREIQHHHMTHVIDPTWLYIQRHLHSQLIDEVNYAMAEDEQLGDIATLFGLQVVWVQHETHPLVRVC